MSKPIGVLEEIHGVVDVNEVRCPVHGDVTQELTPPDWDGRASLILVRQECRHPGCGERLIWDVGPVYQIGEIRL